MGPFSLLLRLWYLFKGTEFAPLPSTLEHHLLSFVPFTTTQHLIRV